MVAMDDEKTIHLGTYKKGEISKDVYNFCIKWKIADKDLIAMWKKKGYEKLCCIACAQNGEHVQGTTCICRVFTASTYHS